MFDKVLALETLKHIEESLHEIARWTRNISSADDFSTSPEGMILLNAVCMKLLAIGEEVKGLDRRTGGKLLPNYPSIPWKEVMGLRDIIAHHYFDVDAGEIFTVLRVDLPPLSTVIRQMTADLR